MYDRNITRGVHFRKSGVDPQRINDIIDAGYKAKARESKEKKKETFAPSAIAYGHGKCPRYWYMAFEGGYVFDESGTDAMALANMENGTYFHDRFSKVLEASGAAVSIEEELFIQDPPIRGFIDAIISVDGEEVVIELKSSKQEWFVMKQNSMKPSVNHLYQILIYLKGKGLKNGALIYENKNDQSILVIPVELDEFNEEVIEKAFAWMREVRANWEAEGNTIPKRPWTQKNVACKNCPLFKECWAIEDGTVVIKPMEVVKL